MAPLIVTLTLDADSQAWFDELRRRYFPPERLLVGAHVTLFHALPGDREAAIAHRMHQLADAARPFPVAVTGVRSLGRGAAFTLAAAQAASLRGALASVCTDALSPQDRQGWRPHITIQNKVSPSEARETCAALGALTPPQVQALGWALWRYLGGPWESVSVMRFSGLQDAL